MGFQEYFNSLSELQLMPNVPYALKCSEVTKDGNDPQADIGTAKQ